MNLKRLHWRRHLIIASAVVALVHGLTIWAVPRLIMDRIIALGSTDSTLERTTVSPCRRRLITPSDAS